MGDILQVNFEQLPLISTMFANQAEIIANLYDHLQSAYRPLEQGDWMGHGSQAFISTMQYQLFPTLQRLMGALNDGSTTTSAVARLLREAEIEAAAVFQGTLEALPSSNGAPSSEETGSPIRTMQQPQQSNRPPIDAQHNFAGTVKDPQPTDMIGLFDVTNKRYLQPGIQTPDQQQGPIGITQIGDNRYMVTLVGVEADSDTETNSPWNAFVDQATLADSDYTEIVRNTIKANVPPGAEIVFVGHSHGGIVAQKLAADTDFNKGQGRSLWEWIVDDDQTDEYTVTHVITHGSPATVYPVDNVQYQMYMIDGDPITTLGAAANPHALQKMKNSGNVVMLPNPVSGDQQDFFSGHYPYDYHQSLVMMQDPVFAQQYIQRIPEYQRSSLYTNGQSIHALPFQIDQWGETYTFQAEDMHADQPLNAAMP